MVQSTNNHILIVYVMVVVTNQDATRLKIRVKTRANKFKIVQDDDAIIIHVKSAPTKGKANQEIIKKLSKSLGISSSMLRIVSGATSTDKTLEIDLPIEQVKQKLDLK